MDFLIPFLWIVLLAGVSNGAQQPPKFVLASSITAGRETREVRGASSSNNNNNNGARPKFTIASSTTILGRDEQPAPLKDCDVDGKQGNPGAQIRYSESALDEVYKHAMRAIVDAIKEMSLPDVMLPLGGGILSIKNARIVDSKLGSYVRELVPERGQQGQIRSCMYGGRIVSVGDWTFKTMQMPARTMGSGEFRVVVLNPELNVTNEFARRHDGKPMMQTASCQASLKQFRVEIEGFGDNTTVIDQCDNMMCTHIRSYFQNQVCLQTKTYIDKFANQKLATFPTKIKLGPWTSGNKYVLDYSMMQLEPKITKNGIQASMEGRVLSRGSYAAPINPVALANFDVEDEDDLKDDKNQWLTFKMSDYVFNTLFHHAHAQQFKFSAFDLIPSKSPVRSYLKMRCPSKPAPAQRRQMESSSPQPSSTVPEVACLGELFESNSSSSDESSSDTKDGFGELIFKSQRPMQVVLQSPSYQFGVDGGMIEAYGAPGSDGKRELLARADVQWIRGSFMPKMDGCNVTGSVHIDQMRLVQSSITSPAVARIRSMPESMLDQMAQLCSRVFTETFGSFLDQYAQFPMPLTEGLECESPQMQFADNRTIQIRSGTRATPEASRVKKP